MSETMNRVAIFEANMDACLRCIKEKKNPNDRDKYNQVDVPRIQNDRHLWIQQMRQTASRNEDYSKYFKYIACLVKCMGTSSEHDDRADDLQSIYHFHRYATPCYQNLSDPIVGLANSNLGPSVVDRRL